MNTEQLEAVRLKFASGNSMPVERASITRAEWDAIEALLATKPLPDPLCKHGRDCRMAEKLACECMIDHILDQPKKPAAPRVVSDEVVKSFWNRIGQAHPTKQLVRDALVWLVSNWQASSTSHPMYPTYYVKHPDGSFSQADMSGLVVMTRSEMSSIIAPAQPSMPVSDADMFSPNDGDNWYECIDDAAIVGHMEVGQEFTVLASREAWEERYVVTKVPDDESDEYEVKLIAAHDTSK